MKILQEIEGFAAEVGADADHLWEAFKAFVRKGISDRAADEAPAKEEAAPAAEVEHQSV